MAARERLDAGEYVICLDCDHPIPPARLKAIPEVELCVPCQGRTEREAEPARRGIERVRRVTSKPLEEQGT